MKRYRILIEPEAATDLEEIHRFISENDSTEKADRFLEKLYGAMISLETMPFRFRRSFYSDHAAVREMIVRGYTVTYLVGETSVHILTVFRQKNMENERN